MKTKTNKNIRKVLSIALCLALVMSYVPVMALGADGKNITIAMSSHEEIATRFGWNEGQAITNCYTDYGTFHHADMSGVSATGSATVTADRFKSGEIAYLLQANQPVEEIYDDEWNVIGEEQVQVWGQDSNRPGATPIFDTTGLYKVIKIGETGKYSVANIGDTNSDENVDVTDYQVLVNKALSDDHEQIGTASYGDIVRYDLDGDGCLDAIDASLMERMINGHKPSDVYAVGDIDHNGKAFEEAELSVLKHSIENPTKLSTAKKYACDINGDGKVSEVDLTELTALYGEIDT